MELRFVSSHRVLFVFGILLWSVCVGRAARLIDSTGEELAPSVLLVIDGNGYMRSARHMIRYGSFLIPPDTYHSTLVPIVLAASLRLSESVVTFKRLNLVALVAISVLSFLLFRYMLGSGWGLTAWCLLALSQSLVQYAATMQYELWMMAILLAFSWLVAREATRSRNFWIGFLLWLSAVCRPHYLLLSLWMMFSPSCKKSRGIALGMFILLAGLWNGYYMWKTSQPFFFWDLRHEYPIARGLSATSSGVSFPKSPDTHSGGLQFIIFEPLEYLKLLQRRLPYLTTFSSDIWHVPSVWENAATTAFLSGDFMRKWVAFLGSVLGIIGAVLLERRFRDAILAPLMCVLLVQLIINASFRFVLPALPQIVCLQVLAMRFLVEGLRGSLHKTSETRRLLQQTDPF